MIVDSNGPRPVSKVTQRWARRLEKRKILREARQAENQAIDEAIKEAMLDSGATSNFIKSATGMKLTGPSSKVVSTANGQVMKATMTAILPLTQLKGGAREAVVIPEMSTKALMSVKQLADQGYTTIFHPYSQGVSVHDNDGFKLVTSKPPLLQGWRDQGGLWTVPLVEEAAISEELNIDEAAMNVYELPSTKEVIRFLHAALGFPTKATLLTAIRNGNLVTFPGLTADNVNKHFPESDETQKGHMKQARQGVRSTKVIDEDAMLEADTDHKPKPGVKHKDVYLRTFDATKKSMYTDQTGRFPITSSQGHKYMMVAIELDGNYIDVEPLKSRTAKELTEAYKRIHARWKSTGVICPNWHVLDNEAPAEFLDAIRENKCRVEKTPADIHRRNLAERAIQTYKSHFISTMAGVSDDFPIHQWHELVPQTVLTLNLLRQSNVAPKISAYAYHHGSFDYNRMPLAPMGCAVQFHIKPNRRKTWGERASDGWYLTTSPDHYRCHWIFVKATRAKRISDTVFFKHKHITQPTVSAEDLVIKAVQDLTNVIKGSSNSKDDAQIEAIQRIAAALKPGNQLPIEQAAERRQRIQREQIQAEKSPLTVQPPRVQTAPPPRVRFDLEANEERPFKSTEPPQLIVKSPKPKQAAPKSILKSKVVTSESIADRVKSRRQASQSVEHPPAESIASRVARRRREAANPVLDHETGKLLEYRQLLRDPKHKEIWNRAAANEFGRLAQGVGGRVEGTNTIQFIHKHEIPQDRWKDVTYVKFVSSIRTEKDDPYRIRATLGGNLIHYPEDVGTPTADLLLIKIFLNSVVSTEGAKFATADISNFYLMTPLKRPEFGRVKLSDIPEEIIKEYELEKYATADGWVYFRVIRGMYGLPQAGANSHDELEERLNKEGYFKSPLVPALWKHKTRPTQFVLIVDDFGIKYFSREDLDHLVDSLKKYYEVKVDPEGRELVKIELDWDYENKKVHLSMKPYLDKLLRQFNNVVPKKRQDSPFPHVEPKYGAKVQFAEYDQSKPVGEEEKKHIQKVNGKCIWYGRGVDGTILTPLSAIAAKQSKPTEQTVKHSQQLLDYLATQEPAVLTYRKSDMVLAVHSDASYLNEEEARSRAGGHHFLSENVPFPPNNGAIHNVAEIIKGVMSSASEAELGSMYINARKAVEERIILEEMGHKQPATPFQVDNSTAEGIVNKRVQPKRTKAMDMRFHWLRDRSINQKQFRFYWRPGPTNNGDYWTKHHPASHHRNMRPVFLTPFKELLELRKKHPRQ